MLQFSKCFFFFLTWDLIKMTKEVIEGVWIHLNKENSLIFYVLNKNEIFDVLYFRKLEIAPVSLNKLFWSGLFLCAPSCSFLTWRAAFSCLSLSFHPYSEGSPSTSRYYSVSVAAYIFSNLLCNWQRLNIATMVSFLTLGILHAQYFVLYNVISID